MVDGNQLCDLGRATQIMLFYRGLSAMAQSKQSLDIGYLTASVNAYCQAISGRTSIDFMTLIGHLSHPTLFVREPHGPFHTNGCRAPECSLRNFSFCIVIWRLALVRGEQPLDGETTLHEGSFGWPSRAGSDLLATQRPATHRPLTYTLDHPRRPPRDRRRAPSGDDRPAP
jgi:hypothetical protein